MLIYTGLLGTLPDKSYIRQKVPYIELLDRAIQRVTIWPEDQGSV